MGKNRVIAGAIGVAAAVALMVGPATAANAAPQAPQQATVSAEASQGSVQLARVRGIALIDNSWWYMHGGVFEFSVTAAAPAGAAADAPTVFVSVPDEIVLRGFSGAGWACGAVDGGVNCTNAGAVGPGQSWPVLNVRMSGRDTVEDTLDVYLQGVGDTEAHDGVPFLYDTST